MHRRAYLTQLGRSALGLGAAGLAAPLTWGSRLGTGLAPLGAALSLGNTAWAGPAASAAPPLALQFPRDLGSHPDHGIEWWYLTGYAQVGPHSSTHNSTHSGAGHAGQNAVPTDAAGQPPNGLAKPAPHKPAGQPTSGAGHSRLLGFQITFFRFRVGSTQSLASSWAAKQVFMAHAAVSDVQNGQLLSDHRLGRARRDGLPLPGEQAGAALTDTAVVCRDWRLQRQASGEYVADLHSSDFALQLRFAPTQTRLLQGAQGWSRKGPQAHEASFYYSEPQLAVQGQIRLQQTWLALQPQARAWLDHEWSQQIMPSRAVGWDWIGMNLHDGAALTAFRLRDAQGQSVWAGGSWRAHSGAALRVFGPHEVRFVPQRFWTSPRTGARYPVQWAVQTPAGEWTVSALFDAQELDGRGMGQVYWEGLSALHQQGQQLGLGYLEMTGYAKPLAL